MYMRCIGRNFDSRVKSCDGLFGLVLTLQNQREQAQTLHIIGVQREQFAQQLFGRVGFPLAEVAQR